MAQNTVLAAGITSATSTDIVVAAGEVVKVGIFAASAVGLPQQARFNVLEDTPGGDNVIAQLSDENRSVLISAPGTYRVSRRAYAGTAFGVYTET
jgi:hypothetical protein